MFFLAQLPPPRMASIAAAQLALPVQASAADRLVALMHQCPTLHKLGQVVARDHRLAPALRERLQTLESLPPSVPMDEILPRVQREVGLIPGLEMASEALAEGSVAVVVPFVWRPAASLPAQHGVFKLLKPGVANRLHEELDTWPALGDFLEHRSAELGLAAADYRETLDSVRRLLVHEVRLDLEQTHLAAAAERYADAQAVRIPRLLPFSTPQLTAMERIDGVKVTAAHGISPHRRRRLGEALVDALLARPFWSPLSSSPFHADPHAGNLLLDAAGRIAILDWSLVVELGAADREALVRLVLAALAQDAAAMCRTLAALGREPPADVPLRAAVEEALRQVRRGRFPGLGWALDLLDRVATTARLRFPEPWMLFRKALLTLAGVVEDLSPDCAIDGVLAGAALSRCAEDLALMPALGSRRGGFHCQRFAPDVLSMWMGWPATVGRYWYGQIDDWARAFSAR